MKRLAVLVRLVLMLSCSLAPAHAQQSPDGPVGDVEIGICDSTRSGIPLSPPSSTPLELLVEEFCTSQPVTACPYKYGLGDWDLDCESLLACGVAPETSVTLLAQEICRTARYQNLLVSDVYTVDCAPFDIYIPAPMHPLRNACVATLTPEQQPAPESAEADKILMVAGMLADRFGGLTFTTSELIARGFSSDEAACIVSGQNPPNDYDYAPCDPDSPDYDPMLPECACGEPGLDDPNFVFFNAEQGETDKKKPAAMVPNDGNMTAKQAQDKAQALGMSIKVQGNANDTNFKVDPNVVIAQFKTMVDLRTLDQKTRKETLDFIQFLITQRAKENLPADKQAQVNVAVGQYLADLALPQNQVDAAGRVNALFVISQRAIQTFRDYGIASADYYKRAEEMKKRFGSFDGSVKEIKDFKLPKVLMANRVGMNGSTYRIVEWEMPKVVTWQAAKARYDEMQNRIEELKAEMGRTADNYREAKEALEVNLALLQAQLYKTATDNFYKRLEGILKPKP